MGRTTGARVGVVVALLLAVPAWATSMVEINGTLATHDAAAGGALGSTSALHSAKDALQRSLPKFTPPKIDEPANGASTARPRSPSAPSVHGGVGGGGWKAANTGGSPSAGRSGWATAGTSRGSSAAMGQGWTSAASGGHTSGASGWKAGAASTTPARH